MSRQSARDALFDMRKAQENGDIQLASYYAQIYMAENMAADYANEKGYKFPADGGTLDGKVDSRG